MQKKIITLYHQFSRYKTLAIFSYFTGAIAATYAAYNFGLRSGMKSIKIHIEYDQESAIFEIYTYSRKSSSAENRIGDYFLIDNDGRVLLQKIYTAGRSDLVRIPSPLLSEPAVENRPGSE